MFLSSSLCLGQTLQNFASASLRHSLAGSDTLFTSPYVLPGLVPQSEDIATLKAWKLHTLTGGSEVS